MLLKFPLNIKKQTAVILFCLMTISGLAFTNNVQVRLFDQHKVKTISILATQGKYYINSSGKRIAKLKTDQVVYLSMIGDSISVWDEDNHIATCKTIELDGVARYNSFRIEAAYPALTERHYEGDLSIKATQRQMELVNKVTVDQYLAGVVEAEAGPNAPFEFYKAQAIISRTYLMEIMAREGSVSYFLKDNVYHQVYKGMSRHNPDIKKAVVHTKGLVIVDQNLQLITAAFHSNSGGQTANSEQVWLSATSYLKGKADPYSKEQRNTQWTDSVPVDHWLKFFKQKGINTNNSIVSDRLLNIEQQNRQQYLIQGRDTIAFRTIREAFGLRSAWFNTQFKNGYVIISGQGYGHGVGLSQEGGMEMARQGFSFIDIINFYYQHVNVVHYSQCLRVP